jgi:hypothetical protein
MNRSKQKRYYNENEISYNIILGFFIGILALVAIVLSIIALTKSSNRDTETITYYVNTTVQEEIEWIEYNYTSSFGENTYPFNNEFNMKFVTDNRTIVFFWFSYWQWPCTNLTGIEEMNANSTIPSYLMPSISGSIVDTPYFPVQVFEAGESALGYIYLGSSDNKLYAGKNMVNSTDSWTNAGQTCEISPVSGSYLLFPLEDSFA